MLPDGAHGYPYVHTGGPLTTIVDEGAADGGGIDEATDAGADDALVADGSVAADSDRDPEGVQAPSTPTATTNAETLIPTQTPEAPPIFP